MYLLEPSNIMLVVFELLSVEHGNPVLQELSTIIMWCFC